MSPEVFNNANFNYQIRKIASSYRPVTRLLKVFSINYPLDPEKYSKTTDIVRKFLTSGVLCAVVLWSLYYKIMYFSHVHVSLSIKLTDGLQLIFDYLQSVVDLYFVYKNSSSYSLEYLKQYLILDEILGITLYTDIRKRVLKLVIIFILIWMASSVFDFVAIGISFGYLAATVYASSYLFVLVKTATILDMTAHIIHVEYRITYLKDMLQRMASSEDVLTEVVCDSPQNRNWSYLDTQNKTTPSQRSKQSENDWIPRTYLGFLDQTIYINKMYGLRILLNSLSLITDMVKFCNILLRLLVKVEAAPVIHHRHVYFPIISNLLRIFTGSSLIFCLVFHCERIYRQRENIIDLIDNRLILRKFDEDLSKSMVEFRTLVYSRPLEFHLINFFRLDFNFLTSTATVVVTYTIILLQNIN